MLLIFMFMFICRLSKKKIIRNLSLPHSSSILLIFMFMFICQLSQKKKFVRNLSLVSSSTLEKQYRAFYLQRTRCWYARVPYYKELEFTKLKYHIIIFYCTNSRSAAPRWNETRNSSLLNSSTI